MVIRDDSLGANAVFATPASDANSNVPVNASPAIVTVIALDVYVDDAIVYESAIVKVTVPESITNTSQDHFPAAIFVAVDGAVQDAYPFVAEEVERTTLVSDEIKNKAEFRFCEADGTAIDAASFARKVTIAVPEVAESAPAVRFQPLAVTAFAVATNDVALP